MMPTPKDNGNAMYVLARGTGHPILFLHGMPTSSHLWDGIIDRMHGKFTCLAVDLPGLGRTATTPQAFHELVALADRMEALRIECNVDQWHVVGHDAGCAVAVHYAHRYQDRVQRLALLSPSIFPELKPFRLFEILRKPVLGELMAPAVSLFFWKLVMRWAFDYRRDTSQAVKDFNAPFGGLSGSWRLMSLMRWGDPAQVLSAIPALLPELKIPTLIFHGSKDRAVPRAFATRTSQLIPNSELIFVKSGHFLPLNEPEAIASELIHFFGQQENLQVPASTYERMLETAPTE